MTCVWQLGCALSNTPCQGRGIQQATVAGVNVPGSWGWESIWALAVLARQLQNSTLKTTALILPVSKGSL
jgi:hypothetical protein